MNNKKVFFLLSTLIVIIHSGNQLKAADQTATLSVKAVDETVHKSADHVKIQRKKKIAKSIILTSIYATVTGASAYLLLSSKESIIQKAVDAVVGKVVTSWIEALGNSAYFEQVYNYFDDKAPAKATTDKDQNKRETKKFISLCMATAATLGFGALGYKITEYTQQQLIA